MPEGCVFLMDQGLELQSRRRGDQTRLTAAGGTLESPRCTREGARSMREAGDIVAIQQLLALYGHVIDEREWQRVGELFTATAVYDMSDFGLGVVHGAAAIRELWSRPEAMHPLA